MHGHIVSHSKVYWKTNMKRTLNYPIYIYELLCIMYYVSV